MSFDPKNFINISKELLTGTTEAHYRSIINRAYYGAFGHVNSKLLLNVTDKSVHQEVIKHLKCSINLEHRKIANRLESLFKKRKDADYKYFEQIKFHNCEYVIHEAEDIIKKFNI